ncbi:tRNA 2-thiouridine(34) synthase MnmA [Rhizobiaceae bacterium n13]|uniref:tRNA-specific 2-thiouridylase MnmA n=1 Tax=Ferirhizobium litorale TaxID=2927786 RepID=A0AAE3Q9K0_9HYPH|nr:tRNA 2-thiouridine(34) synthase MnmA [Fererhizobium litorale]MDI7860613.1 tRNA 2-thiouridine(34) synthase MnmA [Fererhizobium litorale]MDI7920761.1 tRNA 2-thiouridine(34) synthase MnmA [Fererhizobium litorale]
MNTLDIDKRPEDTRVVVAMSGGVDSSVVAGILNREGYDVLGITLQLYDHGAAVHRAGSCCAGQDIDDARRVCETLGIPHYVLDYEKRFRDTVINPFMESYVAGETPIPCVSCNQTVKFADLLATARELGADALATGHYIRSRANPAPGNPQRRALFRPIDSERDQSYFLFATTQEQIDYLRFPLGGLSKAETRALAEDMGLVVAKKADSQDICFVPQGKYADVIAKLKPNAALAGDIVHLDGRVLGNHEGIVHYTIGQRRGIGIATGEPLYVVYLDARSRRVIVGPKEALETHRVYLRDINWLGDAPVEVSAAQGFACFAKVRSTRPPAPATLRSDESGIYVDLEIGEAGIAPGQACVLYSAPGADARVFGGGFIERSQRAPEAEASLKALLSQPAAA